MTIREIDRLSLCNAKRFYENGDYMWVALGSVFGLQQIHELVFDRLFPYAGKNRTADIRRDNFRDTLSSRLDEALHPIYEMETDTLDETMEKFAQLHIVHPFLEGNGRALRIWLDVVLRRTLGCVVDWIRVHRTDYRLAMQRTQVRTTDIKRLIQKSLTDDIDDFGMVFRGLEQCWRYEEIDIDAEEYRMR